MVATAIYSRKSTDQPGVTDETKSVARQVDRARAYAAQHGWTVSDAHIFVDDGISGAEFKTRPGFVRLMNALTPRAPFDVLIVSELSRLGREQLETGYALKQLSQAGVKVFSYLEDRDTDFIESFDFFESDWIKTGFKEERLTYRHWFNERKQPRRFYMSYNLQKRLGLKRRVPADRKSPLPR